MQGWRNGAHLPAEQFRAHFLGPYGSEAVAAHLRAIGQILGTSAFPKDLAVASEHLAQVVQLVGPDNFARFATTARDLAKAPLLRGSSPPLVKAQELLLEPRPFLFADPPKGVLPRLMERIPGQSGKEAAKGVPSWARGIARRVGETPRQYAKRVMDDQYGAGKWEEDPERQGEFRKIQKHGSRAFRNPMTAAPPPDPGRQQPTA